MADDDLAALTGQALYDATFPTRSLRPLEFRVADAHVVLDAVPDGWSKVGGRWVNAAGDRAARQRVAARLLAEYEAEHGEITTAELDALDLE